MPRLTAAFLVFAVTFVAFELSINGVWQTDHSISFVQLDYAMWHDHSFALTSATMVPPWSVDDFVHNGQNYSALAPGAAFLALPFTGLGFTLAGKYTAFGPVLLLSETFVALMGAVAAYLLYALASLYFRPSTSVLLGFAFAFSTTLWPMATYFFQSDVSAAFVLLGAYLAVKAVRAEGRAPTLASLSGLAAGLAFTVDYVNGVLLALVLGFLVVGRRGRGDLARISAAFVLGALPGLAAIGAYNYSIFGNPLVTTEQSYQGASSVFSSFSTSPVYGLALDLFSFSRGLLILAPFVMLGVVGYIDALRNRSVRLEMWFFIAVFLAILVPYSMWYDPFGGLSFGPRFLVAAIPFLLIPAGFVVEQAKGWKMQLVYAPYFAGVAMNGVAAVVTAIPVTKGFNDFTFLSVILPRLQAGNLDASWGSTFPYPGVFAALLVAVLGAAVPITIVGVMRRREGRELGASRSVTRENQNGAALERRAASQDKGSWGALHSFAFALACRGLTFGARHALSSANDRAGGEPVGYLGHLDLALPALLGAGHENDETVNLRNAVTAPADLGNGNVILLSDLNWLWLEGPEAAASAAASPVASSSETRLFTS